MLKRILILLFILLIFYVGNAFLDPFPIVNSPLGFRPNYGFSYSFEQANWYGYDPKKELLFLFENYKFSWVRLPFFWDQMTDKEGNLKIDDLSFAISEARKRNIKVIIALGAKTPYYPEYHLPEVERAKVRFGDTIDLYHPIARDILAVDEKLVKALSGFDNISYWQVENEPFLANVDNIKIGRDLLAQEVNVVRANDPLGRPIILNSVAPAAFNSSWKDLFKILKPGDVFGVNAYFKTQGVNLFAFSFLGKNIKVPWPKFLAWPVQSWYGLSADFSKLKKYTNSYGIDFWVLEAQSEPYIRTFDDAKKENYKYAFSVGDIDMANKFLESYHISDVGLWGANFWLFRNSIGDYSWTNKVREIVN